jgi:hypothetical protein
LAEQSGALSKVFLPNDLIEKMDIESWIETFYADRLWISTEALEAQKNADREMSESESEESFSISEESSQSSSSSTSQSSTVDLHMPVFVKKFKNEQLYMWARLRIGLSLRDAQFNASGTHDSHCVAFTKDSRKVQGSIDLLQDSQGYLRKHCQWENIAWVRDPYAKSLLTCEYFHEACMGMVIRKYLADIPVFHRAFLQFADLEKKQLHFSMVGGKELDNVIHKLNAVELESVIFQVLVSLCIAQDRIKLKHHDLHLGNVMVVPRREPGSWVVDTPFGKFTVPLVGYDATIIDFGLSSCVVNDICISRVDADLLALGDSGTSSVSRASDVGRSWGVWDPDLTGDTGYDFTMFVESIIDTTTMERPLPIAKLIFLSELQKFAGSICTDRNRPVKKSDIKWSSVFETFLL